MDADEAIAGTTLSVLAGMPEWWARRAAAAGLTGRWLEVGWAVSAQMPDGLDCVRPTNLTDRSAAEIGDAYTASLNTTERARHGRHYTPAPLAGELWAMAKRALGWKRPQALHGVVRDRACGAGALLLPVLRDHLGAAAKVDAQLALAGLPNHIVGIDNDPAAAWLANVLLAAEMLPVLARTERARRRPLPALVAVADGLAEIEGQSLVEIMNPPYGRVKLEDTERMRFADYVYGHANLYGLFMAAGLEALQGDGVLAALVPTSFLTGRYFEKLRDAITKRAPLRAIEFVEDRDGAFEGVLQETCLASFSRTRPRRASISTLNGHVTDVAMVSTPRSATPWLLPRRSDDAPVAVAAATMPLTLATAGWRVSTGPLVWNRRKGDLRAASSDRTVPILWAADIDGGTVHRDPARDDMRYLVLRGDDERVLVLAEPAILVQRTTAPEQSRRLVFAPLTRELLDGWGGRVVVENHVNVVRPAATPLFEPLLDATTLGRLFATMTIDRVLRCLTGSVAVSAYELESLPLPSADAIATWAALGGSAFERAISAAYRPASQ